VKRKEPSSRLKRKTKRKARVSFLLFDSDVTAKQILKALNIKKKRR
jgi:hypothetical protein